MARIAWFTPLPPVDSDAAVCSAAAVPALSTRFQIDLYADERSAPLDIVRSRVAAGGAGPVYAAHEFVWRHYQHPYDLTVYQYGSALDYQFAWPFLVRYPGLVVLHDLCFHRTRADALLRDGPADAYRAEVAYNHPDAPADLAELFVTGEGGTLHEFWPMFSIAARTARLLATHNARVAATIRERHPGLPVDLIRMGVAEPGGKREAADLRRHHGIPDAAVVFGALGPLTPDARIIPVLRALGSVARTTPNAWLLLVGELSDPANMQAEISSLGLGGRVVQLGPVPAAEIGACVHATDVGLHLRWPTTRETSASWIRSLAAGKPTIISDLAHLDDVPALDPRCQGALERLGDAGEGAWPDGTAPCAMCIDVADEVRTLALAFTRLAQDAPLRTCLGRAAHDRWQRRHMPALMALDYERSLARTFMRPPPDPDDLPAHLQSDGMDWMRTLLAPFRVTPDFQS